jgi:hypothetical protein
MICCPVSWFAGSTQEMMHVRVLRWGHIRWFV